MEETKGFVSARDALAALEQYQGCFFPHSAAVKIINQLSREDVEPVIHARWIEWGTFGDLARCSSCGADSFTMHFVRTNNFNYCPNCGAKMEERVEHTDD